ncbi:MAG TPA: NAD(P)-dependent oxidoreductase [Rickettsiales bacterium]|nr:NAD(P)-dependent oxidoreductase [Rickettsiales bacterium]
MMYPVSLDLSRIRIALVGTGEAFSRRLQQLQEMGAINIAAYEDTLPESHEIRQANVLMIVGLDDETSAVLVSIARLQGILVNVEDKPALCDFHFVAFVKRGDLTISVSTGGASPTLGQEIRGFIANLFKEEWADIVTTIGKKRLEWKSEGLDNKSVSDRTRGFIRSLGLLGTGEIRALEQDNEAAHILPSPQHHGAENVL